MQNKNKEENATVDEKYKSSPRDPELVTSLKSRLSRISGQVNGLSRMIDDNRYCRDILIQIAACRSALASLGDQIMKDHINTCVKHSAQRGEDEKLEELTDLFSLLK